MLHKSRVKTLLAALALTLTPLATIGTTTTPAHADSGCRGKIMLKGDPWQETGWYSLPSKFGQWVVPQPIDVRVHATLGYWHCANGRHPAKLRPKWIDWCWFMPNREDHLLFTGVTFNGVHIYDDSGRNVNPDPYKVGDDGSRQNCGTQYISDEKEAWLRYENDPRWRARFTINLTLGFDDEEWQFETASGGTVNHLFVQGGVNLGWPRKR